LFAARGNGAFMDKGKHFDFFDGVKIYENDPRFEDGKTRN
jgi:hypothetical protein